MTLGRLRFPAPRVQTGTGARPRPSFATVALALAWPTLVVAQERPDSVPAPDSAQVADSLLQEADSLPPDTIFYNMPTLRSGVPSGYATGIWEWDREDINAIGANTLVELFQEVPGLVMLLGGDYGTPAAMSIAGGAGGGYRVFRDGFELYALDGSVADLQEIGLVGIGRVRLDRSGARMVVELFSYTYDDGRPFSVVEAGTGDYDTNMLRGVFTDPTALFGSVGGGIERVDTRGRSSDRSEAGNRTGGWARYQFHVRDRAAIGVDFRRLATQTRVPDYTPETTRTDLMLHAGWTPVPGVVLEAHAGRSTLDAGSDSLTYVALGGSRTQYGGHLGLSGAGFWANGSYRLFEGDLPARSIDAAGGFTDERWGGVAGRWAQGAWNDEGASAFGARAWFSPLRAVTLFGAWETGTYGARRGPVEDGAFDIPEAPPADEAQPGPHAIADRETLRVGASLSALGITLAGAALYASSDTVFPLGTELDLGADPVDGVHRNGFEAFAVLPTFWRGLTLQGSYQWWDEPGPYLPERTYQGSFEYHRAFRPTGNLELWASVGVRGHDAMDVFVAASAEGAGTLATVPFYQSWYGRIQVRILTVRLWLGMDNVTFRRNLQTYPGRVLPYGRSFFGLRWDMWN